MAETSGSRTGTNAATWLDLKEYHRGHQGIQGVKGEQGTQGIQGVKGEQGESLFKSHYLPDVVFALGDIVERNGLTTGLWMQISNRSY